MARPNTYRLADLRAGLKPFRLHFFPTLRSTNDRAAEMRRAGELFAPAVVLAARQTAGRGRGANTWFSGPGSITVTFVLPASDVLAPHHVPLAAGLAARNAVAEITHDNNIQLKWPNDLVYPASAAVGGRQPAVGSGEGSGFGVQGSGPKPAVGGRPSRRSAPGTQDSAPSTQDSALRTPHSALGTQHSGLLKLAGLLCERLDNVDLIGIGLNVNLPPTPLPPDLAHRILFLQQLHSGTVGSRQSAVGSGQEGSGFRVQGSDRNDQRARMKQPARNRTSSQPEIRDRQPATSALGTQDSGLQAIDLTSALITLARHLHLTLVREADVPVPTLLHRYDQHHALLGRTVTVLSPTDPPLTGRCEGLDHTGRLLLRTRSALHRIISGHIELLR